MNFRNFLVTLNTHFVGIVGGVTAVVGFVTQPTVSPLITGLLPPAEAAKASSIIMLAGAILAYLGKPKSVLPTDGQQVAVAAATNSPRPVTFATAPAEPEPLQTTPGVTTITGSTESPTPPTAHSGLATDILPPAVAHDDSGKPTL